MSGLLGNLSASVTALNAQSNALATAGRNLANANNANYARQRVMITDNGALGVASAQIGQLRDSLLDRQVTREISLTAALAAGQSAYAKAQAALGQTIDRTDGSTITAGLGGALGDFFNAFESLAASPTDLGVRQTLLQTASILADNFKLADTRLAQLQGDLTGQVETDAQSVNTLLETIATLNGQIGRIELNAPGTAVDLRDQRQAKLEELAGLMNFETRASAGAPGQLDLFVRDAGGVEIPLVSRATVAGPVSFDGTGLSAGAPAAAVSLAGGSIKGALDARDGGIRTLRDQLDALAAQLVSSVNAAYNPTGTTGDFFDAAGTAAGTIGLAPGLTAAGLKASDGGAAGDNTLAAAVAALAGHAFSTAGGDAIYGTFASHFAQAVSELGATARNVTSQLKDQGNLEAAVRAQRDAVSGVSMDEELADLLKYQRSFQASSRVISVIDELLDTIVNRLI